MNLLKGALLWLIVLAVGVVAFAYSGIYSVSAMVAEGPAAGWFLETVRENSVDRRTTGINVPRLNDRERVSRGGESYGQMCESCHGAPGKKPSEMARGMRPKPPRLYQAEGERSWARVFWITKHGIRMTGMPAWGLSHSDEQIWDIVAFIKRLPTLSAEEYRKVAGQETGGSEHRHSH